ncbi:MAG TPA: alpha/beta fold hydrolase [Methylomirabilota bacterium]|nr:alpha/beta fold hydrolase [Methylomirabilota bacterium]
MQKLQINNRKGQIIVVVVEEPKEEPKGLVFVLHGLSGNKEEPHIVEFAKAFHDKNYTVVKFDTTNTFGESAGKYEDATVTTYYDDLADVINWAKTQPWYQEPFCLVGHSLGGIAVILYGQKHPQGIKGLAPISSVVSGKLSGETWKYRERLDEWQQTGWLVEKSTTNPGRVKRLPWSHMVDRLSYNVLPDAKLLTMPVLMIVGDKDDSTPPEHQQLLYEKLPGKKEIHIIKGAPHSFVDPEHLAQIRKIFLNWIDEL